MSNKYTKEDLKAIVLGYAINDGEGLTEKDWKFAKESVKLVKEGSWEVDYKSEILVSTYSIEGSYFSVQQSRSASGYWGDPEYYPPEIWEVKPVEVTTIEYRSVE